jgi:Holliday junction resolvasome RuvABC endonuclease subunit
MYTRILAIDPGKDNTGISIIDVDKENNPHITTVETLITDQLIKKYSYLKELHGERFVKHLSLLYELNKYLVEYEPHIVVSEDAYYNPMQFSAYASLKELIALFRKITFDHNPNIPFITIAASSVKKSMGVNGKDGDKELMRAALLKSKVSYETFINVETLSEHAIDSIAIGLWTHKNINNLIGLCDEMVIK